MYKYLCNVIISAVKKKKKSDAKKKSYVKLLKYLNLHDYVK